MILDIAIDVINQRIGGGTKYISLTATVCGPSDSPPARSCATSCGEVAFWHRHSFISSLLIPNRQNALVEQILGLEKNMVHELDTVVITKDLVASGIVAGDIGVVAHLYAGDSVAEVEFVSGAGHGLRPLLASGADIVRVPDRREEHEQPTGPHRLKGRTAGTLSRGTIP